MIDVGRATYDRMNALLPQQLSAQEIAQEDAYVPTDPTKMVMASLVVSREGRLFGAIIFFHKLGVVGSQIDNTPYTLYTDAEKAGDRLCERWLDQHERLKGIRHYGIIE